ncbi:MAG: hypothetical protein HFI34_09385 [Lachnospiraceae bacterium]|nr:hypothetical protein [Lachnospiraceae bacterium]
MENMMEVLKRAKDKKVFVNNEFEELLMKILLADSNLKLDWDDGAGEEWARFSNRKEGIVCMINAKIGVAFIRKNYEFSNIKKILDMLEIVFTEDYSSDNWFIDLANLRQTIPELYWHASERAVNINNFSLDDLYFATI